VRTIRAYTGLYGRWAYTKITIVPPFTNMYEKIFSVVVFDKPKKKFREGIPEQKCSVAAYSSAGSGSSQDDTISFPPRAGSGPVDRFLAVVALLVLNGYLKCRSVSYCLLARVRGISEYSHVTSSSTIALQHVENS
jgi:hypothetical protein